MASRLDRSHFCTLIVLMCVIVSAAEVAGSTGSELPITIYIKPKQPPPTPVKMMASGMTPDSSHMTVTAYTLPAAAPSASSDVDSASTSQMLTAAPSEDNKADASTLQVPQKTSGDTHSDAALMASSATGASGPVGSAGSQLLQQQPATSSASQLLQQQPAAAAAGGTVGSDTTTTTTTTTTTGTANSQPTATTTITTTTTTTSSSTSGTSSGSLGSTGGAAASTVQPAVPPQVGAQSPTLPETLPGAAATAGSGSAPVQPTATEGQPAPTALQQQAAAAGPDQAQAGLTSGAAAATPQPGPNGTMTDVSLKPGLQARNVSGLVGPGATGGVVRGSGARATVGLVSPAKSATPGSSKTAGSGNTAASVSTGNSQSTAPGSGLKPAFAPVKSLNASSTALSPQVPKVISTAFSNISAPPPFVFKQKGASKTIKLGCALPFEGSQKLAGEAIYSSLKMAITDFAPKIVPELNINLTCYNSRCSDIPAYVAVTKLADEGAVAVIGEVCSRAAVAAAGVGNARKIPVISPAATSPALSQVDYFFRTVPSDRYQGVAAAHLVARSGVRNVAIVYEDNTYGFGLAFNFIAGFTKDGGNVPVVYSFKPSQGDPQAAVAKIKAGLVQEKLDGVFISTSNLSFVADFLVDAKSANLGLKFFGGDSLADYTVLQDINGRPSVLANLTIVSVAPGSLDFVNKYRKFTNNAAYSAYAAHAYDAMEALLKAYKAAAQPKDGTTIAQQLGKQKFTGVAGPLEFDKFGDAVMTDKTYAYLNFNVTTGTPILRGFVTK